VSLGLELGLGFSTIIIHKSGEVLVSFQNLFTGEKNKHGEKNNKSTEILSFHRI
jgi:hypothetical protein